MLALIPTTIAFFSLATSLSISATVLKAPSGITFQCGRTETPVTHYAEACKDYDAVGGNLLGTSVMAQYNATDAAEYSMAVECHYGNAGYCAYNSPQGDAVPPSINNSPNPYGAENCPATIYENDVRNSTSAYTCPEFECPIYGFNSDGVLYQIHASQVVKGDGTTYGVLEYSCQYLKNATINDILYCNYEADGTVTKGTENDDCPSTPCPAVYDYSGGGSQCQVSGDSSKRRSEGVRRLMK